MIHTIRLAGDTAEKCAAHDGPCCWHDSGVSLASCPPQCEEVCCFCGVRRYLSAPVYVGGGHGPYAPPGDRPTATWQPHYEHTRWGVEPGIRTDDAAHLYQRWF